MRALVLAGVISATAGAAHAGSIWAQHPQREDIQRVYPRAADRAPGRASLTCKVNAERRLEDCAVKSEEPAGVGFGEAALKLVPKFKMLKVANGQTVMPGAVVTVPIRFDLD